jgi:predicted nucleotidyltransferase
MRPSEALQRNLDEVREIIARFPVTNPRLFGSVARGEDVDGSDLDIIVDPLDGASYFDLVGLQLALQDLLGVDVDVGTARSLRPSIADNVLREARPI